MTTITLKRINAWLGLLSCIVLAVHVGYNTVAYLLLFYNPVLSSVTAVSTAVVVCLHAILGMCCVFLQADGTRLDLYPGLNRRTVVQRVSAALIMPLLLLHVQTFNLLGVSAGSGNRAVFWLLILAQVAFYGITLAHVATSFGRALVTLGWVGSPQTQERVDRVAYVLGAVLFAVASLAVVRADLIMFAG